jgi:hypothetical protein
MVYSDRSALATQRVCLNLASNLFRNQQNFLRLRPTQHVLVISALYFGD